DLKTGIQYSLNNFKSALRYNYNRSNLGIPEEIGEQNRSRKLLLPFQEVDNHILSWDNTLHLTHSKITAKIGIRLMIAGNLRKNTIMTTITKTIMVTGM